MEGFEYTALHITQHKRFAFQALPNFCFAKTSFMLGTLYAIRRFKNGKEEMSCDLLVAKRI
jgi:hypothetical protein